MCGAMGMFGSLIANTQAHQKFAKLEPGNEAVRSLLYCFTQFFKLPGPADRRTSAIPSRTRISGTCGINSTAPDEVKQSDRLVHRARAHVDRETCAASVLKICGPKGPAAAPTAVNR